MVHRRSDPVHSERRKIMLCSRRYGRTILGAAAMMLAATSIAAAQKVDAGKGKAKGKTTSAPSHFRLTAADFVSKGRITPAHVYNGMGCNGQNVSPALQWSNPPAGPKPFPATQYDPDAPNRSRRPHWRIYNIPPSPTRLRDRPRNGPHADRRRA